mgnify:CR=1 FL=1
MDTIKQIINRFRLTTKKSLGQNYILDQNITNKVTNLIEIKNNPKLLHSKIPPLLQNWRIHPTYKNYEYIQCILHFIPTLPPLPVLPPPPTSNMSQVKAPPVDAKVPSARKLCT